MDILSSDFGKASKPSRDEWVGIVIFVVSLLLTLDFTFAFAMFLILFGSYSIIKYLLYYWKTDEKKFFVKLKKSGMFLLTIFTILYILDVILTYLAVVKTAFAVEQNGFVVLLWNTFGYTLGQGLHMILFGILIIYSQSTFKQSKNYKRILVNFMFILMGVILWTLTLLNNLTVLYFVCGFN